MKVTINFRDLKPLKYLIYTPLTLLKRGIIVGNSRDCSLQGEILCDFVAMLVSISEVSICI